MAGKNGKTRSNRNFKRKNIRRTKRQSPSSTGYGGLLARGIRTLLSVLPGSLLIPGIVDFAFKSLGYTTKSPRLNHDGTISVEFQTTGLTALFHLALKDILIQSFTHGTRLNSSEWESNYFAGRLRSMCIKLSPQTPQSEIRGMMSIVFIPFRSEEENKFYNNKGNIQGLSYEQVKLIPGAKSGPAGRPISLYFKPRVSDGRLNYDIAMGDEIGAVLIGFEQMSRSSYAAFSPDEFACTVTVSGVVELQRPREAGSPGKYSRKLDDKMASKQAVVLTPDRKLQLIISKAESATEELYEGKNEFVRGIINDDQMKDLISYLSGDLRNALDEVSV